MGAAVYVSGEMVVLGWASAAYLVFFEAVFEYILDYQASSLAQCNLVPHATESLVDIRHNLRRRFSPT